MIHNRYWYYQSLYALIFVVTLALSACGEAPAQPAPQEPVAAATATTGEIAPVAASDSTTTTDSTTTSDSSVATTASKLNLNTASGDEFLAAIPGFGNRMVREFEEYRPYVSIQQFRKEMGKYVDEAQIADYENYVFVPINRNESDEATLQQIPGVTAEISAQLIAARPFANNDDFLKKLAEIVPSVDQIAAKAYLTE